MCVRPFWYCFREKAEYQKTEAGEYAKFVFHEYFLDLLGVYSSFSFPTLFYVYTNEIPMNKRFAFSTFFGISANDGRCRQISSQIRELWQGKYTDKSNQSITAILESKIYIIFKCFYRFYNTNCIHILIFAFELWLFAIRIRNLIHKKFS